MVIPKTLQIFLLVFLGALQINAALNQCDFTPLRNAFRRIDQQFEHLNYFKNDLQSSLRNLQSQNAATRSSIDACRSDIRTYLDSSGRTQDTNLGKAVEGLRFEVKLVITALKSLYDETQSIRENITSVFNSTNTLLEKHNMESTIQTLFGTKTDSTAQFSNVPRHCQEINQKSPQFPSGIYGIRPEGSEKPFMVFCDMDVDNGGWLVVHNRYEGVQDFYLGWEDYKVGFGNIAGEFWLGLEKIHQLTENQLHELLIELVDMNGNRTKAHYSYFSIGPEEEGYPLKVLGGYNGNAGDSLTYHAGSKFSTKDRDQDSWNEGSCAQSHAGAWWYKSCDKSNLNGRYAPGEQPDEFLYQAMYWGLFGGPQVGLLQARMLIKPKEELFGLLPVDDNKSSN